MNKIHGNTAGLKASDIRDIQRLYRRRIPPERVVTHDLAREVAGISRRINRQTGLLLSRRGEVLYVIVGDHRQIVIPDLGSFRSSSARLKGLRLIHTHLDGEGLTGDDLTDLALLRLDMISAIEVEENGLPGRMHTAHLIPENPGGEYWLLMDPVPVSETDLNFSEFIQALDEQFARRQGARRVTSTERAIMIRVETDPLFDSEASMAELRELARSSGVEVFDSVIQHRNRYDPKYLMGRGRLSDLVIRALQIGANLLIFDHELSPAQVRSITDFTELKVIDRSQLILDIFARRAHSREGKIQVELAQMQYLFPRLATKNTAMSRLTGGIGGTGPGETKLEINRRRARDRIGRLKKELKDVRKGRGQRRRLRQKRDLPVISIIGYTNTGKSTLLNALTKSSVLAENRLFATLDPKSSRLRFPRDREAIITDTVGFIRNLPKELASAFRATLEELDEADLLLHVIDVSNPGFEEQIVAVEKILEELDLQRKKCVRVFNKVDLFPDRDILDNLCRRFDAIPISALDPKTLPPLLKKMGSGLAFCLLGAASNCSHGKKAKRKT
ncbi:MAG: GTPase HflX [Deltaproteobacteria bacterium]|nr:GTPase HflX [Deltaproteobacteria bacterium]